MKRGPGRAARALFVVRAVSTCMQKAADPAMKRGPGRAARALFVVRAVSTCMQKSSSSSECSVKHAAGLKEL
jgi:hypothetical protein